MSSNSPFNVLNVVLPVMLGVSGRRFWCDMLGATRDDSTDVNATFILNLTFALIAIVSLYLILALTLALTVTITVTVPWAIQRSLS